MSVRKERGGDWFRSLEVSVKVGKSGEHFRVRSWQVSLIHVGLGPPPRLLFAARFTHCHSIPCPFLAGDTRNLGVVVNCSEGK